MSEILNILSTGLYFITGVICLIMAFKSITAKKYLPFHEKAAGISWEIIDKSLQNVILTIIRISGLGFLVVFLLLTIFPVFNYSRQETYIKYMVPLIALIFCFGLFLFNYLLYKKTNAKTPWTGSLIAMIIILFSLIISLI
jgi:hypothetical protein